MNKNCNILHKRLSRLERYIFPFNDKDLPKNGIYILFEKGEKAHQVDRIVRIGTHTGKNQLISRLKQHFMKENKDRSIFRKNIGRVFLNMNNDGYLEKWDWDLTTSKNKEKYLSLTNPEYELQIEKKISEYIQENFSFAVIEVGEKEDRLRLESRLISEVSLCDECVPSDKWIGRYSPKVKIQESGLWLVNELYKERFSEDELYDFLSMLD